LRSIEKDASSIFGVTRHASDHRTGDAAQRVAAVEQFDHAGLVRDRQPQAVDVACLQRSAREVGEGGHRYLRGHQHGIDAVLAEQVVEDLRRAHLGDGVAEDQEDAGGAGDVHVAFAVALFDGANDRQPSGSPQGSGA
jgi:hypothetical protein